MKIPPVSTTKVVVTMKRDKTMTNYRNAPQTTLLKTNCIACGRPLVDAISVQLGIGPECRQHQNDNISIETQNRCNQLTHRASIAAQEGSIDAVNAIADEIEELDLMSLQIKLDIDLLMRKEM